MALPITKKMSDVYAGANTSAIALMLSKMGKLSFPLLLITLNVLTKGEITIVSNEMVFAPTGFYST